MPKPRKAKKPLSAKDFAGEGEPYSEVIVTISIRFLGSAITRSRLAVITYPDPALESLAKQSLNEMKIENYGFNQDGVFGACLCENFNGWEDMGMDYPRISEESGDNSQIDDARAMNAYIKKSVDWIAELHKEGMAEAMLNDTNLPGGQRPQ
jgi:hypothetical protein